MRLAFVLGLAALSACVSPPVPLMKGAEPLEPDGVPAGARGDAWAMRPTFEEIRRLQREILLHEPESDREKLRLALLELAVDDPGEAGRLLAGMGGRPPLRACLESFLAGGDGRPPARFEVERAELARNVTGFRRYEPSGREFRPADVAVVYVEPSGFALREEGGDGRRVLHLSYAWKLFDDRGKELRVPAWEDVDPRDREDRVDFRGPVSEFYQFFKLRLPANLAAGDYRIQVTVEDLVGGASDRAFVDLTILAVSR